MFLLPRQARDRHRERARFKKERRLSACLSFAGRVGASVEALHDRRRAALLLHAPRPHLLGVRISFRVFPQIRWARTGRSARARWTATPTTRATRSTRWTTRPRRSRRCCSRRTSSPRRTPSCPGSPSRCVSARQLDTHARTNDSQATCIMQPVNMWPRWIDLRVASLTFGMCVWCFCFVSVFFARDMK
eukprot:COSAG06_NODE_5135_length_3692_cov_3.408016_6_plen_189_part_00